MSYFFGCTNSSGRSQWLLFFRRKSHFLWKSASPLPFPPQMVHISCMPESPVEKRRKEGFFLYANPPFGGNLVLPGLGLVFSPSPSNFPTFPRYSHIFKSFPDMFFLPQYKPKPGACVPVFIITSTWAWKLALTLALYTVVERGTSLHQLPCDK